MTMELAVKKIYYFLSNNILLKINLSSLLFLLFAYFIKTLIIGL